MVQAVGPAGTVPSPRSPSALGSSYLVPETVPVVKLPKSLPAAEELEVTVTLWPPAPTPEIVEQLVLEGADWVQSLWTTSFFFNDTATTEIYSLSLLDALPISWDRPPSPLSV